MTDSGWSITIFTQPDLRKLLKKERNICSADAKQEQFVDYNNKPLKYHCGSMRESLSNVTGRLRLKDEAGSTVISSAWKK